MSMDLVDHYIRRGYLLDTLDGDTVRMRIDCGYETFRHVRIRVDGIDAAELREPVRGQHAKDVLTSIMSGAHIIWIQTFRRETYQDEERRTFERYVGVIVVDGVPLVDILKSQLVYDEATHKWGNKKG